MEPAGTVTALGIECERVLLRKARDGDADGVVEIQADDEVRRYLGGARPEPVVREAIAAGGAARLTAEPGSYVVADRFTDAMLGTVVLNRRDPDAPGHVAEEGNELELSYVFRRSAWGLGYASEAATALLRAAAAMFADQPVLIVTQSANRASLKVARRLDFRVVGTFEQFDAEQTLLVAPLHAFTSAPNANGRMG